MIDYKTILGSVAVIVGMVGYFPYIRNVIKGTTKPHAFSWLIWGVLETVAFFAQIAKGADAGAWTTGFSAVIALGIAAAAFSKRENKITILDWVVLCGAILGITLWRVTSNPLLAVVCVTVADALGFVPTFRKAYNKPEEETLVEYVCSVLKWIIAVPALGALNLTTWLYPVSLIVSNGSFVIFSLIRRNKIRNS